MTIQDDILHALYKRVFRVSGGFTRGESIEGSAELIPERNGDVVALHATSRRQGDPDFFVHVDPLMARLFAKLLWELAEECEGREPSLEITKGLGEIILGEQKRVLDATFRGLLEAMDCWDVAAQGEEADFDRASGALENTRVIGRNAIDFVEQLDRYMQEKSDAGPIDVTAPDLRDLLNDLPLSILRATEQNIEVLRQLKEELRGNR